MPRSRFYDDAVKVAVLLERQRYDRLRAVARERGVSLSILLNQIAEAYLAGAPRPPAPQLRALRSRIVDSGDPLLSWEELQQEIGERRGGVGERP